MATTASRPKLVAIVGPTASGKSNLAMKVAKAFDGEIISADSRTIYKELNIGTAKPSIEDRRVVGHWGIDLVRPDEAYNVSQFKSYAEEAIRDIQKRGKLPILVGGSGLYVDSIIFNYEFSGPEAERSEQNPRHLKNGDSSDREKIRPSTLIIGLQIPKEDLRRRIQERVGQMIKNGLVEEVKRVANKYGWQAKALQAPGYRALRGYIEEGMSLDNATELFINNDLNLAKRQRTWFKRNLHIQWFSSADEAYKFISRTLNN